VIYGIGVDLVDTRRVREILERYGERFARRILTAQEQALYRDTRNAVRFLSCRFAAKEAFSKALGTGLRPPMSLLGVGVVHDRRGKPGYAVGPDLAAYLAQERIVNWQLSLTDEGHMTCAVAVLEAE
jgi:holo-[acyl-carrier protein] synthase